MFEVVQPAWASAALFYCQYPLWAPEIGLQVCRQS